MEEIGIGTKIKHIRELRNYTQEYMAQMLEVSQSTYARFEKDDSDLTLSKLRMIARILDVKIEDLINFTDKFIFNNYTSNQANQGYIVNQFSDNEKKLYEDKIKLLEDKIAYLQEKK
jgi:transcriptional regulator with XRE-family HTH domain